MAARKEQSESTAKASVNMDELRELISLLRENGLAELELEREDFRVRLRREGTNSQPMQYADPAAVPAAPVAPQNSSSGGSAASAPSHPGAQATTQASQDQDLHIIPSP